LLFVGGYLHKSEDNVSSAIDLSNDDGVDITVFHLGPTRKKKKIKKKKVRKINVSCNKKNKYPKTGQTQVYI